ncbi:hypothetical protein GCK72_005228 [Caenorhabditis remanei]|uniref:Uncharacterized protein n=1 Tax=Caenorhabditis remanei TaxID=31234 RepID=A0A6A5HEQ2_CAERE|nr:hypothetical protein GCK72_005228 [Caenorhabditis remanei]KAF1765276.1 hypothetical protein GCK72_005228 [Caenorhabditis remanei]
MGCTQSGDSYDEPYRLLGTTHDGIAWQLRLGFPSYLLSESEGIAGNGEKNSLLWIENSAWWVDSETFHVGGLDSVPDTTGGRVDHLDVVGVLVVVWGIEDDLGVGLGLDISWWDGLSHGDLLKEFGNSMETGGFLLPLYGRLISVLDLCSRFLERYENPIDPIQPTEATMNAIYTAVLVASTLACTAVAWIGLSIDTANEDLL